MFHTEHFSPKFQPIIYSSLFAMTWWHLSALWYLWVNVGEKIFYKSDKPIKVGHKSKYFPYHGWLKKKKKFKRWKLFDVWCHFKIFKTGPPQESGNTDSEILEKNNSSWHNYAFVTQKTHTLFYAQTGGVVSLCTISTNRCSEAHPNWVWHFYSHLTLNLECGYYGRSMILHRVISNIHLWETILMTNV